MAWGNKNNTKDDTDHGRPRKLPPFGYAQPEVRAVETMLEEIRSSDLKHEMSAGLIDMNRMENEMEPDTRIDRIKDIVSRLTYGEMMTLAEQWADSMLVGTVDKDQFKFVLPPTLHAWTKRDDQTSDRRASAGT